MHLGNPHAYSADLHREKVAGVGTAVAFCVKPGMQDPIAGELRTGASADVLMGAARIARPFLSVSEGSSRRQAKIALRIHVAGVQATAGATGAG